MKIQKFKTKISGIRDVSENAREITIAIPNEITFAFLPGQFMNFFVEVDGKKERRAYSISSSQDTENEYITFTIRRDEKGKVSPVFWGENILKKEFEVMGPIGLNTADKLTHNRVFLLAMGVGISPVKSIIDFLLKYTEKKVILFFGNKNEHQILYKKYFDDLAQKFENFDVIYVLDNPENKDYKLIGFVQDFIIGEDFENASVYICGMHAMAQSVREKIIKTGAKNVQIMEESFG